MQSEAMVSFSDCSSSAGGLEGNKGERCNNLERTGRRNSILSGGYWRDSHDSVGEDIREKFSNAPAEAAGARQYKGMVPQPNGRSGYRICEKRQRVWPGTFMNGENETAKAISDFKLGGRDTVTELKPQQEGAHLKTRVLTDHSKGEIVGMLISKHTYDEEPGNSKKIDMPGTACLETADQEEEKNLKGSERISNPRGGEPDDKKTSLSWQRREHMFEKAVTPSDVGKLNRLVIPKQQAEKYFPLDTGANERGSLLNFEDSTGKAWRFRYSYWNSSQSYVLTKGWSRFVKEKKLDAGDIVSFDRATHQDPNLQRLFISCRRKPCNVVQPTGLPGSIKWPFLFSSHFQFPSDAVNNIGGSHGQQLISSRTLIPQWKPLFWQANSISGESESCRSATETCALQANAQPVDLLTSLPFIRTEDKPIKGIHDSALPFSIQRSSNTSWGCRHPAMDTESSARAPPLDAFQLKSGGISGDDLSRPIENKVPEAATTAFDHSTSKKVVRLFGVDLDCGKVDDTYEDELHIFPPSERLFP